MPEDASLRPYPSFEKGLADHIQARTYVNNATSVRLQAAPRKRDIELRETTKSVSFYGSVNANSAMVYMKGTEEEEECTRCANHMGPYAKCVVFEGELGGACAGCYYGWNAEHCSLVYPMAKYTKREKPTMPEKPSGWRKTLSGISSRLSLVTRKRKAEDLEDATNSMFSISAKKPRLEEGSDKWEKTVQELKKQVEKMQHIQESLGHATGADVGTNAEAKKQLQNLGKCVAKIGYLHLKLDALAKEE